MKKIIQKTTRAFDVPSLDNKSAKAKGAASRRSSMAIEHILFTEEDLLEQAKKINPKKTNKSDSGRNNPSKFSEDF